MSYFLGSSQLQPDQECVLNGEEAQHILLSRRMKVGDVVTVQGSDGKRYDCKIILVKKHELIIMPVKKVMVPQELLVKITLLQSVISEKALDFILQKSTELGVAGVILFNSKNTATKLTKQQFAAKSLRWNKILWEAAKQCDRGSVPKLDFFETKEDLFVKSGEFGQIILCEASTEIKPLSIAGASAIGLCVGPEGGFAPDEVAYIRSLPHVSCISLSPFILRAETAAISGLAVVQNQCCSM